MIYQPQKVTFFLLTVLLSIFMNWNAHSQTFQFKHYDSYMGLPQNFIYSLEQGKDGFLWIGTGEGLVRYDGIRFESFTKRDSLADDFIMSLLVARDGKVWIGHNNGNISVFNNGRFTPIEIPGTNSPIRNMNQDSHGNIWAVIQNSGFVKIDRYMNITTWFDMGQLDYTLYYSIFPLDNNQVLLGTSDGLLKLNVTNDGKIESIERFFEIPSTTITVIKQRKGVTGEYWIGTEDEGFFHFIPGVSKASHIINNDLCIHFNLEYENIQDIEEKDEGHLLLATWGNGVIQLFYDPVKKEFSDSFTFSSTNGLSNNFVKRILSDTEGNYWFATYGGGVSSLTNESMIFYDLSVIGFQDNKARSVFLDGSQLWIGLENGLLLADPYCFTDFEFYDVAMGLPRDEITGFYKDEQGTIWVATGNNGLFFRKKGAFSFSSYYYSSTLTGKKINGISGDGDEIWLATIGGFYKLDTRQRTVTHLTTENGLPHNNINFVYKSPAGDIWIGPKNSGVCRIESNNIEVHRITDTPTDVYGMTFDNNGNIWLATHGKGVIKYTEDSQTHLGVPEGLAKNFCYGIVPDRFNRLWVTHFPGLSCIDLNTGRIRVFDYQQELGADFYQVVADENQNLWFASSQGVINYLPEKDVENRVAPNLNFTSIKVSGVEHVATDLIDLPYPYGERYKFRFEFIGISFKNPKDVTYQYKLQRKGDSAPAEWVNLGNTTFREYEYLPDGEYLLQIRASNSDGIYNRDPLSIRIVIAPPIWKKAWFYLIVLFVLSYSVYLIIVIRERNLRRQKEALQREVNSQTVILRLQKAEIERKNRDITDSINYAKRIQSSILPPIELLEEQFNDSFVFFAPRDIVSGDFYWFHPFRDKYLVCAADCTGHGVPGAFMSMIGSTLLNDIVKRNDVHAPSQILTLLDMEIKILLQKNLKDTTRDGMDISMVEIDRHTGKVRLASAKRPVYLFINGEMVTYKGNRRSIGDSIMEDESKFVDIEYKLAPNDTLYIFSDGYSDQFGGSDGKKFMTANVRKMLENIHHLPMKEQMKIIRATFFNWKGEQEQVDDVVFIGIKI